MFLLQPILKNVSNKTIEGFISHFAKNDNWHKLDKKTGDLGYGWIHYSLIRTLKPKKVLCVGSKYGYIPAICALACKDNGFGKVDFVDANYSENKKEDNGKDWAGVGFWSTKQGKKQFDKFRLTNFINIHIMTTKDFFKKSKSTKWGYVYLDGDHSYKGVLFDFKKSWPRLERGGFLGLHDTHLLGRHGLSKLDYEIPRLWREIRQNPKYNSFEFPGSCGLGILQK